MPSSPTARSETGEPGAQAPAEAAFVRLRGVTRRFGTTLAVDGASFDLPRGQFMTILGPSGSGKSTLLRMIAGFLEPTAGDIRVHGQPVAGVPPYRRSVGMVFQRLALFPHMSARENIVYPLRMRGFPAAEMDERVARYLSLVQLEGLGHRRIHELSGGQQQRVAIARALVFEPDLLLLDEPLSSLDRKLRETMQLEFRRIQQELGVTTINVTHDQREALVMSDRIAVMDRGRIEQSAPPAEAYARPATPFVAEFIGVTNFFEGRVVAAAGGRARLEVGGHTLEGRAALGPEAVGGAAEAAVRAEQIRIGPPESPLEGVEVAFEAEVVEAIFEGDRVVYTVSVPALGGREVRLFEYDVFHVPRRQPGARVRIGWRAGALMIFPKPIPSHQ